MKNYELRIRNVDAAAMEKLNQLAKEKGMSRNAYVKHYLESLSVLGELKEMESKYELLLNVVVDCVERNNEFLRDLKKED